MQGMVLTSDSAARQLKNMNRDYNNKLTWQNALNSVDASATQAQQQLQQSYTDASAQAYAAYLQNRAALAVDISVLVRKHSVPVQITS